MTASALVALAAAMFLLAIVPGPGVIATLARALSGGFRPAAWLVGGIVLGDVVFLLVAIYGLSFLADILGAFFVLIRLLGGAYLIWLGVRLLSLGRQRRILSGPEGDVSFGSCFMSGFTITLSNPKVVVFYLSFLPTFIDLGSMRTMDVLATVIVVVTVLGGVLLGYAFGAAKGRALSRAPRANRWLQRIVGAMLIGSGLAVWARAR